jgi:murein DD-endopeptidase MepM/ murein hydrolase activator NlpD
MTRVGELLQGPWDGKQRLNAGWRYASSQSLHAAYDIGTPMGTKLYALGDGVVVDCNDGVKDQPPGKPAGSGAPSNWIILKFIAPKDSRYAGATLFAYYQHLKQHGVKVKKGQRVKQGDLIGLSGNSGNTSGPHLHLVILKPGFTMSRYTRYSYLGNSNMVVWEPRLAWKATRYGVHYEVHLSKLRPGVKNSKSVRVLRKALIKRGRLIPKKGLSVSNPGNDYNDKVAEAVKQWQKDKGHKPTGTLTTAQAKEFFKNNEHVKVIG